MKFFTRAWWAGEISEQDVPLAYAHHLNTITPRLTDNIHNFIKTVRLHDGLFRQVTINHSQATLELQLRCGDLQNGYYDLLLQYQGTVLKLLDEQRLMLIAQDPKTEILYDEFDLLSDGSFEHSILFWPQHQISIVFENLTFEKTDHQNRDITSQEK